MKSERLKEIEAELQKIQFELQSTQFSSTIDKSRQDCAINAIASARSHLNSLSNS